MMFLFFREAGVQNRYGAVVGLSRIPGVIHLIVCNYMQHLVQHNHYMPDRHAYANQSEGLVMLQQRNV